MGSQLASQQDLVDLQVGINRNWNDYGDVQLYLFDKTHLGNKAIWDEIGIMDYIPPCYGAYSSLSDFCPFIVRLISIFVQNGVERGCCICGWTTEEIAKPILASPTPRDGCGSNICTFSSKWDAWCKADTGRSYIEKAWGMGMWSEWHYTTRAICEWVT